MENQPAFRPFGDRYLVLPDPVESQEMDLGEIKIKTTPTGTEAPIEGTVVAKGPRTVDAKIGDKVVFGKYSGSPHNLNGVEYKILKEAELMGEHIVTPFDEPLPSPTLATTIYCLENDCLNVVAPYSRFCSVHQQDPL